jgi:hypothetical protein
VAPGAAANDVHDTATNDADLAADADFVRFCDERRDAWIDAIDDDSTY